MKKYSFKTRRLGDKDAKMVSKIKKDGVVVREQVGPADRAPSYKGEATTLLSSEEFIKNFKGYLDDIAMFKKVKGRKFLRPTTYAAIGIMDINDIKQEVYLAFLEAYSRLDWNKLNDVHESERGAMIWSFLKQSTILKLGDRIREKKDGMRITQYESFKDGGVNTNFLTKLFSQLDKVFFRNQEDVALTKWETDLTGMFLEVHMDEHLDLTRAGNRDLRKQERLIIKSLYGIDQPRETYAELSDKLRISQSTIRSVRERAIKRLQSEESKEKIANFLHEYRINTQADTEKYRK